MKFSSTLYVSRPRRRKFSPQLGFAFIRSFYVTQSILRTSEMLQRAFGRPSVLALHTRQLSKPVFDFFETRRLKLQLVGEVAEREREVFQQRPRRFEPFKILAKLRFVSGKLLDSTSCLPYPSDRGVTVFINQAKALDTKCCELFDIVEPPPFLFKLFFFADHQPGAFKLVDLESEGIDQLKPLSLFGGVLFKLTFERRPSFVTN